MELVVNFKSVFVVLYLFSTLACGDSRASFGENCGKSERYDSRKFLCCSTCSACECLMPNSMLYDEIAAKCVTLAGERCPFTSVDGENNLLLPCISNGTCNDGVCECLSSHFELANGTCSEKRGFGEMCTSDVMCNSAEHLTCGPEKICICNTSRELVLEDNDCKLLAGSICDRNHGAACILGSSCSKTTSRCECDSDRFQTVNDSCIRKRNKGDSCSSNTECLDMTSNKPTFLICEEGKCVGDSTFSVDDNSGFCRKQLCRLCTYNDCIQGADCIQGICQCVSSTHFLSESQTCEKRRMYGESCANDGQCISSLKCGKGQKCGCANGTSFSVLSNKCVSSAGSSCRDGDRPLECVPNAYCGSIPKGLWHEYTSCKCLSNFKSSFNQDGFCYAVTMSACIGDNLGPISSKQCLPGLVCRDGNRHCRYRGHQIYDSFSETCKSLIGGPCDINSDCSNVEAECYAEDELRECKCKEGYNQVGRECRVSNGGKCDVSKNSGPETCDKVAGLECTSKGVCECPALQEYNKEEMLCKGLIGAKCSVKHDKEKRFCGPLSFCKPFRGSSDGFGKCTCLDDYKSSPDRRCVIKIA